MSLFDTKFPDETLNALAQKVAQLSYGDIMMKKPKIRSTSAISDFVEPRSTVLFKALGVPHSLLALSNWRDQPKYYHVKTAMKNFTPLNDCSEQALAFATTLCGVVTQDESSHKNLILVVEHEAHKMKYHLANNNTMKLISNNPIRRLQTLIRAN